VPALAVEVADLQKYEELVDQVVVEEVVVLIPHRKVVLLLEFPQ
jgi:hypothetical protein